MGGADGRVIVGFFPLFLEPWLSSSAQLSSALIESSASFSLSVSLCFCVSFGVSFGVSVFPLFVFCFVCGGGGRTKCAECAECVHRVLLEPQLAADSAPARACMSRNRARSA